MTITEPAYEFSEHTATAKGVAGAWTVIAMLFLALIAV